MSDTKFIQKTISASQLKHPEKYVGNSRNNITYRSSWERSFILDYLDPNPNIVEWSSEEVVVPYISSIDHKRHRYFPDFYIRYNAHDGSTREALIEIKPEHEKNEPKLTEGMSQKSKTYAVATHVMNKAKWEAARNFAAKRGWKFIVLTEKDICFFGKK
jgi:hypothetical protein